MIQGPIPGLVIRYSYLWRDEHLRGQDEGMKDRPCAVIVVTAHDAGEKTVTVLPITHAAPIEPRFGIELPAATKRRLGLDDGRSWIILSEANRFIWPGPDLRPGIGGDRSQVAYGVLPARLFEEMRMRLVELVKAQLVSVTSRTG